MVQNMDEFSSLGILNSTIIIFYSTPAHSKVLVCDPVSFDCCAVPIASITVVKNFTYQLLSIFLCTLWIVDIFVYVRCIDFRYDHKNKAAWWCTYFHAYKKQIKYWCTVGLDKKNSSFLVCMIDAQIMFAQKHKNYVDRCTQIFARINYYIYMHFLCTKKSQFFLPDIEMHKISRCTCLFFLNPISTKVHTHFFVQEKMRTNW